MAGHALSRVHVAGGAGRVWYDRYGGRRRFDKGQAELQRALRDEVVAWIARETGVRVAACQTEVRLFAPVGLLAVYVVACLQRRASHVGHVRVLVDEMARRAARRPFNASLAVRMAGDAFVVAHIEAVAADGAGSVGLRQKEAYLAASAIA